MSTKRTLADCLAVESVAAAELVYLGAESLLEGGEAIERGIFVGEASEITSHERTDRGAFLGCSHPRQTVDVIGNRDRDVSHSYTG